MSNFKERILALVDECFDIEKDLKLGRFAVDEDNYEDSCEVGLRRELYRIRCAVGGLERYAEIVDENRDPNYKPLTMEDLTIN